MTVCLLRWLALSLLLNLPSGALADKPKVPIEHPLFVLSATDYLGKDTYTHHPYTDLLRHALSQLGYTLVVMHNPGLRSLAMANTGVVDGELVRIKDMSGDYPNLIMVPEPLGGSDLRLYVPVAAKPASDRWDDFQARHVVSLKGLAIMDYLPPRFRDASRIRAQNYLQAMHLVVAGRADLAILPVSFVDKPEHAELAAQLAGLSPVVGVVAGYTHLHKRHAALVEPLAQALRHAKQVSAIPDHTPSSQ